MTMPRVLLALLFVAVCVAAILGFALRRSRRKERAADTAGEQLAAALAEREAFIIMLHQSNYILACQLHGKEAVDKAIRDAHDRGTN